MKWYHRLIVLCLLLAAVDLMAVVSVFVQGPYGAYWGPTPTGWWVLTIGLALLLMLALPSLIGQSRIWPSGTLLAALAVTAVLLLLSFVRQGVGLQAVIACGAFILGLATLLRPHGEVTRPRQAIAALGILVGLVAAGACGLGMLGRSLNTYSVGGSSPDGQYRVLRDYKGTGAAGASGEVVNVRHDIAHLIRSEWTIYVASGVVVADPRWLNDSTLWVDGQRVSIHAAPPVGWQ